jgi:hypothetical protein
MITPIRILAEEGTKPVNPRDLVERVNRLFRSCSGPTSADPQNARVRSDLPADAGIPLIGRHSSG